ncbi:MAG: hypothetical protein QG608_480 [Actinomycetota bacterium]|nr:hypothetical protein [Actinomycetota bacterium]
MNPSDARRTVIWFMDTASLISMAIDPRIEAAVHDEVRANGGKMVLIDIVKEELEHRACQPDTAVPASAALASLGPNWPWLSTEWVDIDAVRTIQLDVADGVPGLKPLTLHRLFHDRVRRRTMSAAEAAGLSAILEKASRGRNMTESDFLGPLKRLGRPGWP